MKKLTLLLPLVLLTGCFGSETTDKVDISAMRVQCQEQSGFTGNAEFYPGGMFLYRADGEEVAECEWPGGTFKYLGILGHSHVSDTPS